MDSLAALALATELPTRELLNRKPHSRNEYIITRVFLIIIILFFIFFIKSKISFIIKNKLEINLVMVGDPNQSIYQFQKGSDKYLIEYDSKNYYLE